MALIGPAVFEGVYYSEIHVPRFRLEMTFYESELSQVKHQRYEFFMLAVIFFSMTISILKGIYWHMLTKYCFGCFEHHYSIKLCICSQLYINSVLRYTKQCHFLLTTHRVFRNLLMQSLLTWKTWTRAIRS